MYAPSTGSTTSGSGLAGSSERRVRVVRLVRPRRSSPAFGFSMRGGTEHATGFFVSKVEFNSEAHLKGLKVGDQLVSVNGYRVDDAVHGELAHYLVSQTRLKIKVRHVGMLPLKEKAHEPLSWQFVSERSSLGTDVSPSPTLCHDTDRLGDLRLSILVPPRAKLGCGICKGPEWKPGIFVQFVRDGGIAREAGLRPGDQILSCNGQDFSNIPFNDGKTELCFCHSCCRFASCPYVPEGPICPKALGGLQAISAMKVSGRLELMIREGAGVELVSPESSGYNSSASSATGERSPAPPAPMPLAPAPPLAPPAALRRRLASVAEEAADRADRLTMNRIKRKTWDRLELDWKSGDVHNFDAPSDIEPDYDCPSIPNNPHSYDNKSRTKTKKEFITRPSNRTIINLTEDGATIQCSYNRKDTFTQTNKDNNSNSDEKTIVVEVHHTSNNPCGKSHCNIPPLMKETNDMTSISSSATLSSAIAEEIQRRKMKNTKTETNAVKKPNAPKHVNNEKKKQHDALMDEFKKVHRKMFANQDTTMVESNEIGLETNSYDRQPTLPLRKSEPDLEEPPPKLHPQPTRVATDNPPPPPPMPTTKGVHNGEAINGIDHKTNVNGNEKEDTKLTAVKNNSIVRTPTPDYNKNNSILPIKMISIKDEKAELDSLESYKLKNPNNVEARPPSTYFMRAPNGTATMKKHARPVSVTIGEYGGGGGGRGPSQRRQPSRLDFLDGDKFECPHGSTAVGAAPANLHITNRLQSELVMTLSRSNLRKKTEAMDPNIKDTINEDSDASLDNNFHARYGNNILPLPPSISIPKITKVKH